MKNYPKFTNIITLSVILIVALAFRVHGLDKHSLNYDEAITALDARPLNQMFPLFKLIDGDFLLDRHDYLMFYNHGFLYYWEKMFGESEFALRISSVMFSLLSIYLFYILAKDFFGIKAAQLSSILIAVSPLHIYYAQELRPYAAISFFTLLSAYFFLKIMSSHQGKYWLPYIAFSVLAVYFHYMSLLVLFSFCVFFALTIKRHRRLLKAFLTAHSIIIIMLAPIFLTLYPNMKYILTHNTSMALSEFPIWLGNELSFDNLAFTFKNFSIGYNAEYYSLFGESVTTIYFLLFLFGVFKLRKKMPMQLIVTCLFTPILAVYLASKIKTCFVDRYFFSVFPFYLLGVGVGLSKLNKKPLAVLGSAVIVFNLFGLKNYFSNYLPKDYRQHVAVAKKKNLEEIIKIIAADYRPGDEILHTCKNTVFPLKFYARQKNYNDKLMLEINKGRIIFTPEFSKGPGLFEVDYKDSHPNFIPQDKIKAVKNLEKAPRLWLVFSDFYFRGADAEENKIIKHIRKSFNEEKRQDLEGAYIYLFTKK